jgi:phosphatidylinositol alpha-mannosyltransferase
VLVRRGDPAALADALCGLLADPARRAELTGLGTAAAADYDWDVVARRILAVYETVLPPDGGEVTTEEDDAPILGPSAGSRRERTSDGGHGGPYPDTS